MLFYLRALLKTLMVFLVVISLGCKGSLKLNERDEDAQGVGGGSGSGATSSGTTGGGGSGDGGDSDDDDDNGGDGEDDSGGSSLNLTVPENFSYAERGDSLTSTPELSWDHVEDADSYEIAIGTSLGGTDVLDWTDVGLNTTLSQTGLSLGNGAMLYASVRAVGSDGTKGEAAVGGGWQNLACPTGYIKVVGNETPGLGGSVYTEGTRSLYDWDAETESLREISDFCVMKYEAKDSGSATWSERAVSTATGFPWVSIRRTEAGADNDAVEACEAIGDGNHYYLIGNHHWQAIAHDLESVPENFDTSGDVADHAFNRGHSDGSSALEASANRDEGCFGLNSTNTHDSSNPNDDCGGGWHLNKRTHTLSNGAVIWDFAGNVWQWVRDNNTTSQGSDNWMQLEPYSDALKWGPAGDYSAQTGSRRAGLGYGGLNGSAGAVIRGGRWVSDAYTGAFGVALSNAPSLSSTGLGFRCVFAP